VRAVHEGQKSKDLQGEGRTQTDTKSYRKG
jgi:hypothetical protein